MTAFVCVSEFSDRTTCCLTNAQKCCFAVITADPCIPALFFCYLHKSLHSIDAASDLMVGILCYEDN